MVALQENRLTSVPLESVANQNRTVSADSFLVSAALAVGTSLGGPSIGCPITEAGDRVRLA